VWTHVRAAIPAATAAAAAAGWWNTWRMRAQAAEALRLSRERITIRLAAHGTTPYDLPYQPTRAELSRAELLGILGICSRVPRYDLPVSPVVTSTSWTDVVEGSERVLVIPCSLTQLSQFRPPLPTGEEF
jgi:hypothetical protein